MAKRKTNCDKHCTVGNIIIYCQRKYDHYGYCHSEYVDKTNEQKVTLMWGKPKPYEEVDDNYEPPF